MQRRRSFCISRSADCRGRGWQHEPRASPSKKPGRWPPAEDGIRTIVPVVVAPGRVNQTLEALRMGTKLDHTRPPAHMALELWLVEAALV